MKANNKRLNRVSYTIDPYLHTVNFDFFQFEEERFREKEYLFELFDDDVINSPISHRVAACELAVTLRDASDVDNLIKMLTNLRPAFISNEKKDA